MRIELTKKIAVKTIEVIAEVDFFKKSPYIELLDGLNHQFKLENELRNYNLTEPAIKNIIRNLEVLQVVKNGFFINDLKDGFPERELGKYKITYYENDEKIPFKFHIKNIERVKAVSQNIADDIESLDERLLSQLKKESIDLNTNEKFRILNIIDNKGHYLGEPKYEDISLIFDNSSWYYKLANKKFSMKKGIELSILFKGKWADNDKLCEEDFEEVKDKPKVIEQFERDYSKKESIQGWGSFDVTYQSVPIAPNKSTREKWFIHLLKNLIISEEKYFTPEDIEQKWENLFYTTPQISRLGSLPYNYMQVLRTFDKSTEMHWLLQTGADLNPFNGIGKKKNNSLLTKIIIEKQESVEIKDALKALSLNEASELIIIDRYINTRRHFEIIFHLKSSYPNLKITIYSMNNYRTSENDNKFIEDHCRKDSITREVKNKNDIPHDRHWKINKQVYNVSKSINFIKLEKDKLCNFDNTLFSPLNYDEVETQVKDLLGDNINE